MGDPEILDQWGIIDKWWTDHREHRVYLVIKVDDQECTLRYDVQTKTFSIQEEK